MAQLSCIPGTPMGYPLPKVYFFCRPLLQQRYVDTLIDQVRSCRNCDIYWAEEPIAPQDRQALLGDMQLFILPVNFTLLAEPKEEIEGDVAFALQAHIPLLPILMEPDIYEVYSLPHKFGKLPCLRYCREDDSYLPFSSALQLAFEMLLFPEALLEAAFQDLRQLPADSHKDLLRGVAALWQNAHPDKGIKLLHKAARAGSAEATALLLRIYTIGIGLPKNQRAALHYAGKMIEAFLAQETVFLPEQTPRFLLDIALLCLPLERQDISVRLVSKLLTGLEHALGEDHDLTLQYRDILTAFCRHYRRDDFWMLQLCRDQYQAVADRYGDTHPETRDRLRRMAQYCDKVGDPNTALDHYRSLYQNCLTAFGEKAPETLSALHDVAAQCMAMRHHDHARKLAYEVYDLRLETLGRHDPATLRSQELLCRVLLELDAQKELLRYLRPLHTNCRLALGKEHPLTLAVLTRLALLYNSAGQKSRAIRYMRDAHNAYLHLYGADFPKTKHVEELLQFILHDSGDGNT